MYGFIVFIHVIACILIAVIILMQSGRGGGLTEAFSGAESMFGAKTNVVLIKATAVLASLYLITCVSLAFLSSQRERSLIDENMAVQESPIGLDVPVEELDLDVPATTESDPVEVDIDSSAVPEKIEDIPIPE